MSESIKNIQIIPGVVVNLNTILRVSTNTTKIEPTQFTRNWMRRLIHLLHE